MRVLFIDQFSAMGGAQHCLVDLLPALEERGWSASAVIPAGGPLIGTLRARGIPVTEIAPVIYQNGKKSALDMLRFAANFASQISAIRGALEKTSFDLVYVNGPRMLPAAARAIRRRIPLFFHAHNRVSQPSARLVEGIALRQSAATVAACCRAVAQPLERWTNQIHIIPNGTRDLGFKVRARNSDPRIGIIGRIAPEKGQAEFMRAAAAIGREFPDARFVVCGAPLFGDDDYYREVLRLAANLPVEFLDWQPDVREVMHSLDVLVIASTQEGLPRVLLEAFSAGVPVVAFPAGGIPEAIDDRVTGFLAKENLAATIRDALHIATPRLHSIARNARAQWERNYTLAGYREAITNLMELAARRPAREKHTQTRRKTSLPRPAREDSRSV